MPKYQSTATQAHTQYQGKTGYMLKFLAMRWQQHCVSGYSNAVPDAFSTLRSLPLRWLPP
eukprot:5493399-Amphidinium_carterae.1